VVSFRNKPVERLVKIGKFYWLRQTRTTSLRKEMMKKMINFSKHLNWVMDDDMDDDSEFFQITGLEADCETAAATTRQT
jgi:hypothetical protein